MTEKILDAILAVNASGTSGVKWEYDFGGRPVDVQIVLSFDSPADAGQVLVEEADVSGYSGTWVPLATVDFVAAGRKHTVQLRGARKFVRLRMPNAVGNNGTLTARVYVGL